MGAQRQTGVGYAHIISVDLGAECCSHVAVPQRLLDKRKDRHPVCEPLAASDVRSEILLSTPATRGSNAPNCNCGLNNETVLITDPQATFLQILGWAVHREHLH